MGKLDIFAFYDKNIATRKKYMGGGGGGVPMEAYWYPTYIFTQFKFM